MNKPILTLVVVAIAIIGGYYAFTTPPVGDNQTANVAELLSGENAIYVENQIPGEEVVVRGAKLSASGYIVVHLANEDGSAGDIVGGTELLTEGTHENVLVSLGGISQVGDSLIAMLHTDNGDGVVDAEGDVPVVDGDGNIIMMSFVVEAEVVEETTEEVEGDTEDEESIDEEVVEDETFVEDEETTEEVDL